MAHPTPRTAGHHGRFDPITEPLKETMKKAIFATLAAAALFAAVTAAQAATTTCQWVGYGATRQWVCNSY